MGRIALTRVDRAPVFRKIAMGSWRTPHEGSVYSWLEIDMTKALKFMEDYGRAHNIKVSPVHLVGMAIKRCLKDRPEINGLIRGSRIYLRDKIALFFSVNIPPKEGDKTGKAILSGATIEDADDLTLKELVLALQKRAEIIRDRKDLKFERNFTLIEWIPWFMMKWFLSFASWLTYGLNLNFSWLGVPRDPFGSVLITNVGSFGVEVALPPLITYSRMPLLISVGSIREMPFVINHQVVARNGMTVGVVFDHRFMDGVHAAHMSKIFKKCFEDPEQYLEK
ncbi:MAG: 2-oxo acid dehydrogenase subunit E2 [Oligoflexia bacterium]|nr:2-oxo acid dehydrogenase subunit E2 [Oligoflexia bacterium]